jgi:glutathionylspermidine synthase
MRLELRAGSALPPALHAEIVERAVFECSKWNLSAGDGPALCRYPILIRAQAQVELFRLAERLAAELWEAEQELARRPELHDRLGLPRRTLRLLPSSPPTETPRYLRIDFHPTPAGVQITEANSDVAGGFVEASGLTALVSQRLGLPMAGDPAGALAAALVRRFGEGARLGLMHLTQYTDDGQVVAYLARRFAAAGLRPLPFHPRQLRRGLRARTGNHAVELDGVFRFYPADWLARLSVWTGWRQLFASEAVCNPLTTLLTQTKRFPLVWPQLSSALRTWKELVPETRCPSTIERTLRDWVVKPSLGHEGFGVMMEGVTPAGQYEPGLARARRTPGDWVAQRRFAHLPTPTPDGDRFVALGIYVVDGRAAGAYARVSAKPLIDDRAQDAVVLVSEP